MTVEGCGSESLQGDVRFADVMGLMGADVQWSPYSITITGVLQRFLLGDVSPSCNQVSLACALRNLSLH